MKYLKELRFYSFLFYCFALQAQEGGSADLLGLGVPSAAGTNGAVNGAATVTNNIAKFHCKSNGVLYENEILQVTAICLRSGKSNSIRVVHLQIGVKTECRANLARLAIFYGNKTNLPFLNFQPNVTTSPTLGMNLLLQVGEKDALVR